MTLLSLLLRLNKAVPLPVQLSKPLPVAFSCAKSGCISWINVCAAGSMRLGQIILATPLQEICVFPAPVALPVAGS